MESQDITTTENLNASIDEVIQKDDTTMEEHVALLNHSLIDSVDDELRLALLKDSLQVCIDLEFGTIPIYLAALWSIKDNLDPVAKSIRHIVQEEMLHLALVCNLLSSIGGDPKIYDTSEKLD
jgi:rubrerythrin